ncbi:hypothetical protein U0070_005316 [Myodes glareolus]|uniref:Centromere protein K n=1 Tax=Myodes glareolus TaxID=447135 RepID=A0AAW0I3H7_MYOGA
MLCAASEETRRPAERARRGAAAAAQPVKKTVKDMSESQPELDPDITTDMEVVIDTEEELIKQCEKMWKDMEDVSINRIFKELKAKMLSIKDFKEKLLFTLGEFLEDHFPLPDGNSKKKKKCMQTSNAQLITLHEIIEMLINRMFDAPHDPYVKISDSFWPPYIELLLRNGIALRHPEDPTQIRLEAFHQ